MALLDGFHDPDTVNVGRCLHADDAVLGAGAKVATHAVRKERDLVRRSKLIGLATAVLGLAVSAGCGGGDGGGITIQQGDSSPPTVGVLADQENVPGVSVSVGSEDDRRSEAKRDRRLCHVAQDEQGDI